MFVALENLDDNEDINRTTEKIRQYIKITAEEGQYGGKQRETWFNK